MCSIPLGAFAAKDIRKAVEKKKAKDDSVLRTSVSNLLGDSPLQRDPGQRSQSYNAGAMWKFLEDTPSYKDMFKRPTYGSRDIKIKALSHVSFNNHTHSLHRSASETLQAPRHITIKDRSYSADQRDLSKINEEALSLNDSKIALSNNWAHQRGDVDMIAGPSANGTWPDPIVAEQTPYW